MPRRHRPSRAYEKYPSGMHAPCGRCQEAERLSGSKASAQERAAADRLLREHAKCGGCGALFGGEHYFKAGSNGLCTHCEKDIAAGATMKAI